MLLRLPRNLAALSSLCAATENYRFNATTGVRIQLRDDGVLRLDATDGRVLGVVQCPPCFGEWDHAEDVVEAHYLDPDDRTDVIVPAKEWREGLKLKADRERPWDDGVTLATQENQVVIANRTGKINTQEVDGRFPDVDGLFRSSILDKTPRFAVRVDPKHLIRLLQAASAFTPEDESGVTLVYYGPGLPLGVVAENQINHQAFDGLIVPLVSDEEKEQNKRKSISPPIEERTALPSPAEQSGLFVKIAHATSTGTENYLVPVELVDSLGLDEAFRGHTGLAPTGIIYPVLLDELYDADWNLVDEWEGTEEETSDED